MSRDIWLISDTHFNHANILRFTDSRTGLPVRPGLYMNMCVEAVNYTPQNIEDVAARAKALLKNSK